MKTASELIEPRIWRLDQRLPGLANNGLPEMIQMPGISSTGDGKAPHRLIDSTTSSETRIDYESAPLRVVLIRYLWPFWLFRDATRGDCLARAAAYRHNREMRRYLPGYMRKWTVQAVLTLLLTMVFGSAGKDATATLGLFTLIAAGSGVAFAFCLCMLLVVAYVYVYLVRHDYS